LTHVKQCGLPLFLAIAITLSEGMRKYTINV